MCQVTAPPSGWVIRWEGPEMRHGQRMVTMRMAEWRRPQNRFSGVVLMSSHADERGSTAESQGYNSGRVGSHCQCQGSSAAPALSNRAACQALVFSPGQNKKPFLSAQRDERLLHNKRRCATSQKKLPRAHRNPVGGRQSGWGRGAESRAAV